MAANPASDEGQVDSSELAYSADLARIRAEVDELAQRFPLSEISAHDPRLKHLRLKGSSLAEALKSLATIASSPRTGSSEASHSEAKIRGVAAILTDAEVTPLDRGLLEMLASVCPLKHLKALAARLGWDGRGGTTLAQAAHLSGVTRERIRQVEMRVRSRLESVTYFPALDRAISLLESAAAALEPEASIILQREGVVVEPFLPHGIVTAARIFGHELSIEVGASGRSVRPQGAQYDAYWEALRSLSDINHVSSVAEFHERVAQAEDTEVSIDSTRRWLELRDIVVWLDDAHAWFWIPQVEGRNRYINIARRVLAVSPRVSISSLREAIMRKLRHRGQSASLPRLVLARLCVAGGLLVEGESVSSPEPISVDLLGEIETTMHEILKVRGGCATGIELANACLERGINRHSFYIYLSYSPIIERIGQGVYGIRGANVDPAQVAVLVKSLRRRREPALRDFGWTRDQAFWMGFVVTEPMTISGVISVPSAVRKITGERRFEFFTSDGAQVGTLAISDTGNAWGLTPFINRRGLEVGDALIITMDMDLSCAVVHAGSMELLDIYADGEGWGPLRVLEEATRPDDVGLD